MRRNTHKQWPDGGEVFDATIEVPVTIRNPDKPIGTHVFTAMARNDAGLRWTVVTIDNGDDAKDALDRITIPQDVLDRIAPTALPRSSIIISDEPLSGETNYRTEFVAVLNNQPQGGFVTRQPTADVAVASDNFWGDDGFGPFFQPNWNSQTGNTRRRGGQYYHRCNGAGGKMRHAARRPHVRSGRNSVRTTTNVRFTATGETPLANPAHRSPGGTATGRLWNAPCPAMRHARSAS